VQFLFSEITEEIDERVILAKVAYAYGVSAKAYAAK
jgi:hypothetical protein